MNFIRRFWVFGLILLMVGLHVAIIHYVRAELVRVRADQSLAMSLGEYRFQVVSDKTTVYHLHLYLMLDPVRSVKGRETIEKQRPILSEMIGQLLRQSETRWLSDPIHADLKNHLKQEIGKSLNESYVTDLLITDWLELPVSGVVSGPSIEKALAGSP